MIAIAGKNPQEQPQVAPVATMTKQIALLIPMNPSEVDTEHLKTYLIPLKAVIKEVNEYVQRIEQEIRNRK